MNVIIISKTTFAVIQLSDVDNIAFNSATGIYSITVGGTTTTYSADDYRVSILW